MGILDKLFRRNAAPIAAPSGPSPLPGERQPSSETGQRSTPEAALARMYRSMWVDPTLRASILQIRAMDRSDGRVKKIHSRTSRAAAKGGLILKGSDVTARMQRDFAAFVRRLHLDRRDKLESDLRGLMMEGNLPMQWVLDADQRQVVGGVRMPSETINPLVGASGTFTDAAHAYDQFDPTQGRAIASFALWQLTMARLTPDNYDDFGCPGRPYLDATRGVWQKLAMTEEDTVIRRRMRAPLRMSHVLEGASQEDLSAYRLQVEQDQAAGNFRDYYLNKKGAVTALQGDANLEQMADVVHLLDTFFAGAPAPKGLFGYSEGLSRDILADLQQDFFDELDALQDNAAWVYESGFRLQMLLRGQNPDSYDFWIEFAERRTDTPNQRADLALKHQALGVSQETAWESAGIDVAAARAALDKQRRESDPYPEEGLDTPPRPGETPLPAARGAPRVSVTPGNRPKGESATTISTRSAHG